MILTEDRLLLDYQRGVEADKKHPCSICRKTEHNWQKYPHFHGSDFGRCIRAIQFDKLVGKEEFSTEDMIKFRDGHTHEADIAAILRAAGRKVDHRHDAPPPQINTDEFIVQIDTVNGKFKTLQKAPARSTSFTKKDSLIIVGHTDGVIDDEYLLECKAVKDWAFKNKFKMRNIPDNYVAQMRTYMFFLDLVAGFLFAKSRHTSEIRVFEIKRDDRQIIKKAQQLRKIIDHLHDEDWLPCRPHYRDEPKFCRACKRI
jgi:hypothetical protein